MPSQKLGPIRWSILLASIQHRTLTSIVKLSFACFAKSHKNDKWQNQLKARYLSGLRFDFLSQLAPQSEKNTFSLRLVRGRSISGISRFVLLAFDLFVAFGVVNIVRLWSFNFTFGFFYCTRRVSHDKIKPRRAVEAENDNGINQHFILLPLNWCEATKRRAFSSLDR